ncbi:hypothetical protein RIF29_09800 [Crotalaria pallida]|uniref:Serine-threonine/tyrosine-protein kinase catalytic domain-containing protein n=1 Tax=Crotalaria pallida TaxID=3830 RepID=A0AAN9ILP0_CROPI
MNDTIAEILDDEWFKMDYKPPVFDEKAETCLDDVEAVFKDCEGFKRETRFTSKSSANEIINKIEEAAKPLGFDVQKKNYKMKLANVKAGRKGNLNVATKYAFTLKVTEKSDVYSFGVVLMELITGKRPNDPSFGENKDISKWVTKTAISYPERESGNTRECRHCSLDKIVDPGLSLAPSDYDEV